MIIGRVAVEGSLASPRLLALHRGRIAAPIPGACPRSCKIAAIALGIARITPTAFSDLRFFNRRLVGDLLSTEAAIAGRAMKAASTYTARERSGVALVVLSFVLYAGLLLVPMLPIGSSAKLVVAAGLVIVGEGAFWAGCLIAGKEFMVYLRRMVWPGNWRKKASAR